MSFDLNLSYLGNGQCELSVAEGVKVRCWSLFESDTILAAHCSKVHRRLGALLFVAAYNIR